MKEIFKSSVVSVRFSPEYNLVYLTWDGPLTFDKYREPFEFLLHDFKLEVNGIMSDIRKQGIVGPDMRNWLQKEATPKSIARGLRFFYVVSDANVFKQYYVNTIFKMLHDSDKIDRKLYKDFDKCENDIKAGILSWKHELDLAS
jgi:hypothetical protein